MFTLSCCQMCTCRRQSNVNNGTAPLNNEWSVWVYLIEVLWKKKNVSLEPLFEQRNFKLIHILSCLRFWERKQGLATARSVQGICPSFPVVFSITKTFGKLWKRQSWWTNRFLVSSKDFKMISRAPSSCCGRHVGFFRSWRWGLPELQIKSNSNVLSSFSWK